MRPIGLLSVGHHSGDGLAFVERGVQLADPFVVLCELVEVVLEELARIAAFGIGLGRLIEGMSGEWSKDGACEVRRAGVPTTGVVLPSEGQARGGWRGSGRCIA